MRLCVVEEVGENGKERAERRREEKDVIQRTDRDENDLDEEQRVEKQDEENHFKNVQPTHLDLYSSLYYIRLLRAQEK